MTRRSTDFRNGGDDRADVQRPFPNQPSIFLRRAVITSAQIANFTDSGVLLKFVADVRRWFWAADLSAGSRVAFTLYVIITVDAEEAIC
jgi:hypothetical protein